MCEKERPRSCVGVSEKERPRSCVGVSEKERPRSCVGLGCSLFLPFFKIFNFFKFIYFSLLGVKWLDLITSDPLVHSHTRLRDCSIRTL